MSEEKLIGNNLKSFGEELFRNIIINSARKAMLDNIEALSKKDLQKELKEHLQKEFELEDKTKKQKEVLDKIKEYIETHKVSDTISFPLMKKDEEQQVKNCFDYEFNETYKKDLDKILEEIE